jgi:predicted dehydrogenase
MELANDPNVDLVVCCIRVDRHAKSVEASIKAGKDVFVEWPLEANLAKAQALSALAKQYGVRNIVGLQGGYSPIVKKIKSLIADGLLGKVVSTDMQILGYGGATMPSMVDYFVDREVGGNTVTIPVGHSVEYLCEGLCLDKVS